MLSKQTVVLRVTYTCKGARSLWSLRPQSGHSPANFDSSRPASLSSMCLMTYHPLCSTKLAWNWLQMAKSGCTLIHFSFFCWLSALYQPSASTNLSCWCKFFYIGIVAFSTLTFHYHLYWLVVNQYNCFLVRFAQYFRRSPDYKRITIIIMWSHVSLSIVGR